MRDPFVLTVTSFRAPSSNIISVADQLVPRRQALFLEYKMEGPGIPFSHEKIRRIYSTYICRGLWSISSTLGAARGYRPQKAQPSRDSKLREGCAKSKRPPHDGKHGSLSMYLAPCGHYPCLWCDFCQLFQAPTRPGDQFWEGIKKVTLPTGSPLCT